MRKLAMVLTLVASLSAHAVLQVNPTTTLTAEIGSNTSAADTFTSQINGNLGAANISKVPIRSLLYPGSTTKIYVHLMPWFGPSNHMNVGYDSADSAQVKRQVEDMLSRGVDGAILDWYGPSNMHINTASLNLMNEAELHSGFEFAIVEDVGAVKSSSNPQQKLIDDLNYVYSTFEPSPAYMRRGGRPVIFFFGLEAITSIDWNVVRANVLGNPLFIFRNSSAYAKLQTNGGFAWLQTQTTITANYMSLGYLDNFYAMALKYPSLETFGSGFKGFDDALAVWGQNRKILQFCGQTWLSSMAEAGKYYSSGNQLENLQLVTWNDYEEGTELETGIDNCFSVSASLQGSALAWGISGSETTIDHYTVFVSLDGQNLMKLVDVAPGNYSLSLASFNLGPGSYTLYVKAVGKPSLLNHMSNAVAYSVANQPPLAALSVSPTSAPTPLAVTASTAASTDADGSISASTIDFGDGTVASATSASHSYSLPGSYTVTATVADNLGASSSATAVVTATNRAPVAKLAVTPASGSVPLTVSASTAGSSDPDGSVSSTSINFGDGTIVSVAAGGSASHVYNMPGSYTVQATVTDNLGASATASLGVSALVKRAVTISSPANNSTLTSPVKLVATATTPNTFYTLQVYVDGVKAYSQSSPSLNTSLTLAPGLHTIAVKGWDTSGSFMTTIKITVNQPPTAKLAISPAAGVSPTTVTASTAGSTDSDGSIASTTVSFGDGTSAALPAGGSASHVYQTAGAYTLTSTVTDNNGAKAIATQAVTVAAPYVKISAPLNGATTASPVHVIAAGYSGNAVTTMKIYVDGAIVYSISAAQLDTYIKMASGTRRITVQGWDSASVSFKSTVTITVP